MRYKEHKKVMNHLLQQACELLGAPGVQVNLDYWMGEQASRKLRLERQRGIDTEAAWLAFNESRRGHYLYVGLQLYRWEIAQPAIRLVYVCVPPLSGLNDFWVVGKADVGRFYRSYRRTQRSHSVAPAPIMEPQLQQRLWDNTIGLLTRGREALQHFGVARKRGVLLMGVPGNGKTMASRWLADQCRRRGLEWRVVSGAEFDEASSPRAIRALFQLCRPGLVLFDDFDRALQDRQKFGENQAHNTFLTELDGFRPQQGVVYLFATNRQLHEIDPAIRRPGRIDVVLEFHKPTADLRRELVTRTWQPEIVNAVGLETIVRDTNELSFAEIEEARAQLVFHFLDHEEWNWPVAIRRLQERATVTTNRRPIGFGLNVPADGAQVPTVSGHARL
jgi:hypothetical protein